MTSVARVFVCGDVMLGRGIDQIQNVSCDPVIHESYMKDARGYVKLATDRHGQLPLQRSSAYVWGDAIKALDRYQPDVRLINLETSVTARGRPWPGKGIQYRMHPANMHLLEEPKIDVVTLANNHILDWHYQGLADTLEAFNGKRVQFVGVGENSTQASRVFVHRVPRGAQPNIVVYGLAHVSSGVAPDWAAGRERPGVNLVTDLDARTAERVCGELKLHKRSDQDVVIVSIHWGGNWGFEVPAEFRHFARRLIDSGVVSLIHGHSSHHVKGFEVYKNRLILYGCGDFINDYEGIWGDDKEEFRDYLSLMYFVDFNVTSGDVCGMTMVPTRLRHLRVNFASAEESHWLFSMLRRECAKFNCRVEKGEDNTIKLRL